MELPTARDSSGFYGRRIADHFGMQGRIVSEFSFDGQIGLAATRLSCGRRFRERTSRTAGEGAFSILYQIDDLEDHACWRGGHQQRSGEFLAKSVNVVDLREDPQWQFKGRSTRCNFMSR
jgi:AraC family transcriptional regulator